MDFNPFTKKLVERIAAWRRAIPVMMENGNIVEVRYADANGLFHTPDWTHTWDKTGRSTSNDRFNLVDFA